LSALEARFLGQPQASAALFRLVRAGERGEVLSEDIDLEAGPTAQGRATSLRVLVAPISAGSVGVGALVLWRVQDITQDREQARQHVATTQRRLAAYEHSPVGLLTLNTRGMITHINPTLAEWLGATLNDDRWPLIHSVLAPALFAASQDGQKPADCDCDVPMRTGRPVALTIAGSKPTGGLHDVGEQDRVFVVTRRTNEVPTHTPTNAPDLGFAHLYRSAPFGIATVSTTGMMTASNAAFTRLMPTFKAVGTERAIDVLCRQAPPEVRIQAQTRLEEALAGWSAIAPLDLTVGPQHEWGRRIYMSPLTQSQSPGEAAVLYVIDTTEQKALEAKFAQSQKMEAVGNLAGGLAHNFNNVLTAIIGSADLMLQTHRATDPAHKDIQNIKQSANRAAALVSQLMAFSRQQTLSLEVLSLGEVVTDLRPMLKTTLQDRNEVKISTDRDLWLVKADRSQIDQVLLNLAGNAAHAMPNGGTFTVRTRNISEREAQKQSHPAFPVAEYVLLEAEDTGVGMPAEVMAKIFEPFFTTKEIGKGTGFGLATVYGIVKQLSGFIFPESTPGKGTTFRIYLPRAHVENEAEFHAKRTAKKEPQSADLTGNATVLVVEDEDMVRSVAVRSLTRLGYKVLEAGNGLEALDLIAAHPGPIDIVVSDVVMPEMDGPAFLKEIRKTQPDLKIIFVSGHTNEAFKTTMDSNEAFAFLQKPFSLPQLAAKVKEELTR
jgi:two-component system, cell cycle sensor histidine kinase and response regulator CckA